MPRDASSSESERMAFDAPRILNDPVFCRFSHLKKSRAPARASSDEDVRTGVRWILGAIRACAATMAAQLGGWSFTDSTDGALLIRLALARQFCQVLPFSASFIPIKEALWHAGTCSAGWRSFWERSLQAGTSIMWLYQL